MKDESIEEAQASARVKALSGTGILQRLEPSTASVLMTQLKPVEFGAGEVVFSQGDHLDRVYIVVSGKVKVSHRTHYGQEILLAIMGPSDMLGEVSIFDGGRLLYTTTAVTPVHALSMGRDTMRAWIADHPEIADQLLRVFARRLQLMTDTLTDVIYTDVPIRVARRLLQLVQRFGRREDDVLRVTHDLSAEEIAQLVVSDRGTVDGVLRDFTDRGWIRIEGSSLVITDAESLAALQRDEISR